MGDQVCLSEDEFTRSRRRTHPRWEATLSDGSVALMDNDRPGCAEPSAWLRLRLHCLERGLCITSLLVRFRSHVEKPVPDNALGYFFRMNLIGNMSGKTHGYFLIGYLGDDGQVHVTRWKVPELIKRDSELRDPLCEKLVGPSLILSKSAGALTSRESQHAH